MIKNKYQQVGSQSKFFNICKAEFRSLLVSTPNQDLETSKGDLTTQQTTKYSNTNKYIKTIITFISFFLLNSNVALAKDFYYKFNNKDSKVNFLLSTNIHPVNAVVEKFKGHMSIKSSDEKNIDSVEGLLEIDTNSIITHISLCDIRMRKETLNVEKYPKITFKVLKVLITNNKIDIDNTILLKLVGSLSIRNTTRKVEIPVKITVSKDKSYGIVEGNYKLNINDYNVPDPSVLIAKVDPVLELNFKLKVY